MVSRSFKLLYFDGSVLPIFISCCYNNDINQYPIIAEQVHPQISNLSANNSETSPETPIFDDREMISMLR